MTDQTGRNDDAEREDFKETNHSRWLKSDCENMRGLMECREKSSLLQTRIYVGSLFLLEAVWIVLN